MIQDNNIEKLKSLYRLQLIDSKLDSIKKTRGDLPMDIRDLEDEIEGLETRMSNVEIEIKDIKNDIAEREHSKLESQNLITKYSEQQNNVRNNREYDSLSKEIEFQSLEMELNDKKIKEAKEVIEQKKNIIELAKAKLVDKRGDLEQKRSELTGIIAENRLEEETLNVERNKLAEQIEPRLLYAYSSIRAKALNKLAVAPIERGSCGGCFNKIPPQRQIDIKAGRKIIQCEYCGRILVAADILDE